MKKLLSISLIVATTLVAALNAATTNRPLPQTPMEKLGNRTDLYKQQNEARYQKMQQREDEARMRRNMMPDPRVVEENNPNVRAEWRKKGMHAPMNPLRQKQMNQPLVNPNEMRAMPYPMEEDQVQTILPYEDPNAPMQIMPYEDPNAPMNILPYEDPNAPMRAMPHHPLVVKPGEMTIMPYTGDLNENEGMNVEPSTSMFNQSNQDWLKNRQRVPLYKNQR